MTKKTTTMKVLIYAVLVLITAFTSIYALMYVMFDLVYEFGYSVMGATLFIISFVITLALIALCVYGLGRLYNYFFK